MKDALMLLKLQCLQWRKNPEVFPEVLKTLAIIDPCTPWKWADRLDISHTVWMLWLEGEDTPSLAIQRNVIAKVQNDLHLVLEYKSC